MKKIMTVAASAIMALALVGCGGSKKDTLNVSVFTIQERQQPPADNRDYKWLEENFGITFEWDILNGDKDQKIGTIIASGDLPDLVEVDSEKFQGAGTLIDIKPIIEKECPNIMKNYETVWKAIVYTDSEKDAEGNIIKEHVYSLPNYGSYTGADQNTSYNQNGWWIQKCVLQEAGWPEIKTVDQFFDLIEAYYKKHPTTADGLPTIPFSILTDPNAAFNLWNPPAFLAGYPNDGNGHVIDNGDGTYTYKDNFADENAKKWFKMANGYYNRGLIDPASFTDTQDQYKAKISQGRVLGMFIQGWQFMYDAEMTLRAEEKYELTYAPLPLVFDESIKPWYRDRALPNLQRGYGFTTACGVEKATKILKIMDELLKEENQKRLYWGLEGTDYQIDTDGSVTGTAGCPYRTPEQRAQQKDANWILQNKAQLWTEEAPKWEGSYPDGYSTTLANIPYEFWGDLPAIDIEMFKAYNINSVAQLVDRDPPKNPGWYPMWQCNPAPENEGLEHDAALAMKDFETLQFKYLPKMIMGSPNDFEKTWNEFASQMTKRTEVYNAFMQTELDARVKAFGGK